MGAGELKIDARRQRILEELNREGRVVVSELAKELNATTVTIRSDLDALERDGYLERIQGGAVQKLQNFYNLEYQMRNRINSEEKRAIAAARRRASGTERPCLSIPVRRLILRRRR